MIKKYEAPEYRKDAFTCPNCSAFSRHDWKSIFVDEFYGEFTENTGIRTGTTKALNKLYLCKCEYCGYISFWYKEKLIWPLNTGIEAPIDEMPEDIKDLYNEASSIIELSPKGSCAILRLALQKLCNRLVGQDEKKRIDGAIKKLVASGLPSTLQKAMDTVRIVGDEAVHPGEINLDDNKELAIAMFRLINIIIEKIVVEPKEINDLYNLMPDNKLQGIENRDKKNDEKYKD